MEKIKSTFGGRYYILKHPKFNQCQLDQIHRYCYLMGYTLVVKEDPISIKKGMSYTLYNEDKSAYVYLQSGYNNKVTAIFKTSKSDLSQDLYIAETFSIKDGKISNIIHESSIPHLEIINNKTKIINDDIIIKQCDKTKQQKLNVNPKLFINARDLFDIEYFRYRRNKSKLSCNQEQNLSKDKGIVSRITDMLQNSREGETSCIPS